MGFTDRSILRRVLLGLVVSGTFACGSSDGSSDGTTDVGADANAADGAVDSSPDVATADVVAPSDSSVSDAETDVGPDIPVKLPGSIDGVEPEAHAHHPPMIDRNGNLYRVTETDAANGNRPRMMKSSDGGATWSEVDSGNRPASNDLEGCWQLQDGSTIYVSVANSNRVWFNSFHTSDATDRPDQWVLKELAEPGLGNGSGVVQFSSIAPTNNGQFWMFYSGTMISGRQQIAFRRRTTSGPWSTPQPIGETTGSWTGPKAIAGASGFTHLVYKDFINHRLLWRTLAPSGDLSPEKRLDVSGTSTQRISHTNLVRYVSEGSEVVVVAFTTRTGELRSVAITNNVIGNEEVVSSEPVLENPPVALNDAPVAHLAIDGTTIHALWSDRASGDVKHAVREQGKPWTAPTIVWSSGTSVAWWVYGNVYRRGGRRRLGFTYDIGVHADDVGKIEYNEITLGL